MSQGAHEGGKKVDLDGYRQPKGSQNDVPCPGQDDEEGIPWRVGNSQDVGCSDVFAGIPKGRRGG